ncbi:unnamed protein product [Calypogeia fissa]
MVCLLTAGSQVGPAGPVGRQPLANPCTSGAHVAHAEVTVNAGRRCRRTSAARKGERAGAPGVWSSEPAGGPDLRSKGSPDHAGVTTRDEWGRRGRNKGVQTPNEGSRKLGGPPTPRRLEGLERLEGGVGDGHI